MKLYPVTIITSRYGGTYEGGTWIAFHADYVPREAVGDDITCSQFFSANSWFIGIGDSPDEAYADLKHKIERMRH